MTVVKAKQDSTEPELTEERVEGAISLLVDVEGNNGHLAIARSVGISVGQVRQIHEKMLTRILTLKDQEDVEIAK